MIFTSFEYLSFLAVIFVLYWCLKGVLFQNILLLTGSYFFYGYIHPKFCLLIAGITVINYACGIGIEKYENNKKLFLYSSAFVSLGILGFFKYYNFFISNVSEFLNSVGLSVSYHELRIILPIGISFYTFQALGYTIDVYRKDLSPRKNFVDFALFVSFFPQLVAGPIERAKRLFPQIEKPRVFDIELFNSAWPLLIRGFLKKLVIADNIAIYVDKVYLLDQPTLLLFIIGTIGFSIQIYADFSAYTDIARGSARLLGFRLVQNFNSPYLAISPSDFWRRWHISFSSWIRDYLYIPLGGSHLTSKTRLFLVVMCTMGLSGLWHGAAWTFVAWGLYHGILLFSYRSLGLGGRWQPSKTMPWFCAWMIMLCFTCLGWAIFRAPSISWLLNIFNSGFTWGLSGDSLTASVVISLSLLLYISPMLLYLITDRLLSENNLIHVIIHSLSFAVIIIFFRSGGQDFIYFQF